MNRYHVPLFPKRFLVGEGGEQVTELSEVGSETWTHTNIFAGSRLTATYDGGGLHYEMADPLGTKRVQANISGQIQQTWTSLPFGNDLGDPECPSGGLGATEQFFTQKERDCESGNDYFFARYYTSAMGRFTTPDWSAKVEPVPYAKLDDPQSLDLYAYVRNNPVASDDPNGHGCNGWCDLHGNSNQSYSDIINQDEAQIARHAAFLGNTLVNVTTAQQQVDLQIQGTTSQSGAGSSNRPDHLVMTGQVKFPGKEAYVYYNVVDQKGRPAGTGYTITEHNDVTIIGSNRPLGFITGRDVPIGNDHSIMDIIGPARGQKPDDGAYFKFTTLQTFTVSNGKNTYSLTTKIQQFVMVQGGTTTQAGDVVLVP